MKRRTFEAGEAIFREGEASDAAYVVVSGEVEIIQAVGTNHAQDPGAARQG